MLVSLVALIPWVYPYVPAISLIPCGVVWAYLRVKIQKPFAVLLQCAIMTALTFLGGTPWFIALGLLAGGIVAEIVSAVGKYKNYKLHTAGFACFGLVYNLGVFGIMLLARNYYLDYIRRLGVKTGYIESVIGLITWQRLCISSLLVIAGAVLGMYLGKAMLKKHFEKASVM
ncbi:MAG: MptD family putative ECF transporter S component [Treponema phagedenis]|uniref:MptD family putative ECF transporter S component n=1 Tax=Treponema phagedenis TaxID=162 RepID=UPI0031341156